MAKREKPRTEHGERLYQVLADVGYVRDGMVRLSDLLLLVKGSGCDEPPMRELKGVLYEGWDPSIRLIGLVARALALPVRLFVWDVDDQPDEAMEAIRWSEDPVVNLYRLTADGPIPDPPLCSCCKGASRERRRVPGLEALRRGEIDATGSPEAPMEILTKDRDRRWKRYLEFKDINARAAKKKR
jgi:hypothetical protein